MYTLEFNITYEKLSNLIVDFGLHPVFLCIGRDSRLLSENNQVLFSYSVLKLGTQL